MTDDIARTVESWRAEYDVPEADAAWLMCDRHDPAATAFTVVDSDMTVRTVSYGELTETSKRMATVLASHGVKQGDRVPVLLNKGADLVFSLLAIWRLGAVHVPLFTAFATGAIELRVAGSSARLVITEESQRSKVEPIEGIQILQTGEELDRMIAEAEPFERSVAVGGDGVFLQLFTSGTAGSPKGVAVPLRALVPFHAYVHYSLDVRVDDVFWNAADPGWAYGLYYGLVGPLVAGRASLLFRGGFTPESMVQVIRELGVTNFAGAPTMYRALSKSGTADRLQLRRASSAGEPLTPDVVDWAVEALGTEVRDHYGQTELGMVICNHWHPEVARPLRAASMGQAVPGIVAGEVDGQIAIDVAASPLFWFTGYLDAPEKTAEHFTADRRWYLTGDTGHVDADGYFYFTARDDDVILSAGYRIGPFDVESVLIKHPAVAEVAVVGRPDPDGIRGELVEAFVVVAEPGEGHAALERELQTKVREEYSTHAYPRRVHIVDELPKTPSGKIQRYQLRTAEV